MKRRDIPLALDAVLPAASRALDAPQRQWVAAHPPLRFAPEAECVQFAGVAAGTHAGAVPDVASLAFATPS
jgi:hypothetical protein